MVAGHALDDRGEKGGTLTATTIETTQWDCQQPANQRLGSAPV